MQTLWFVPIFAVCWCIISFLSYVDLTDPPLCFQVSSANCSSLRNGTKCDKISPDLSTSQIYCCNITSDEEIKYYINKLNTNERRVTGIHIRDSNLTRLNAEIFRNLPDLVSLSVTESIITRFYGMFDERHNALICLNISRNTFGDSFYEHTILKLHALKKLDFSYNNNLTALPHLPSSLVSFQLDVSGNKKLECKHLINLTLAVEEKSKEVTYANKNLTFCLPPQGKIFTDSSIKLMRMDQVEKIKAIFKDCPHVNENDKCECSVYSLDALQDNAFVYHALVNCSSKQMTSLPKTLPLNTRVLDISNNSIKSLEGIGNETYSSIRELYADNNKISSLKPLEGTSFLLNFRNLTLRNNKIEQVQDYMLSHAFDTHLNFKTILLGENEFVCECYTASHMKMWLTANQLHIPDYNEILTNCESRIRVVDMDQRDFCSTPTNWKDYIRYLIVLEITLFVLLVGKVSYDYYVFKIAGYLPWPASKMPKLPCDWCFEA